MSNAQKNNIANMHATEVEYRGSRIILTHRPKVNDWSYVIEITKTVRLSNFAPRYDTALRNAKDEIDIVLGKER